MPHSLLLFFFFISIVVQCSGETYGGRHEVAQVFRSSYIFGVFIAVGTLAGVLGPSPLRAQNMQIGNSRNVATFTAAQAAQGKDVYAKTCASCHGASLGGSEFASSLRGGSFSMNWGGKTADELFTFINTKMPPASPGSLGPDAAAQLVAFILLTNGVQAGDKEFPTEHNRPGRNDDPPRRHAAKRADDAAFAARSSDDAGRAAESAGKDFAGH